MNNLFSALLRLITEGGINDDEARKRSTYVRQEVTYVKRQTTKEGKDP